MRFRTNALSAIAIVAVLWGSAQGMEIQQFDRMAPQDQTDYLNLLVGGAQRVLIEQNKGDVAAKLHSLFTEILPGDRWPVGLIEFGVDLDRARLADVRNHAKDLHAQRIWVEDAMGETLQRNGIEVPNGFFTVNSSFRPKNPLKPLYALQPAALRAWPCRFGD
jgi:hypothetical protein